MFPNGWPGSGLLILRLVAGSFLIHDGIVGLLESPSTEPVAARVIAATGGVLLIAGLWTPVAGAVVSISELRIAFARGDHWRNAIIFASRGGPRNARTRRSVNRFSSLWKEAPQH